ncbi:MAG: glutaredoxin domain-containing protein [Nitrospirota bacterium]
MKKLIVLALIVSGGFLAYYYFYPSSSDKGAFDENGNPTVMVFTMDNCGAPCADVMGVLKKKNITFEEVNISNEEGKNRFEKFGENGLPLTVIGEYKILGNNLPEIETALTETFGMEILTPAEQMVMKNHFDDKGAPKVVMYGTSWCPYCKKMKEYFVKNNIPYTELDVEKSDNAKMNYDILKGIGYPLTYVGYRRIDGYDETKISKAVAELLQAP